MTLRQDKLGVLFKKLIAQFLGPSIDGAVITVTNCIVSKDAKNATAFIATYPDEASARTLEKIKNQKNELRDFFKKHTRMKNIPDVLFVQDAGETEREKIRKLLETI